MNDLLVVQLTPPDRTTNPVFWLDSELSYIPELNDYAVKELYWVKTLNSDWEATLRGILEHLDEDAAEAVLFFGCSTLGKRKEKEARTAFDTHGVQTVAAIEIEQYKEGVL